MSEEKEMTFWDHLEELRWSLMRIAGVLLAAMILCFIFIPKIFDVFVLGPTSSSFFLYRWLRSIMPSFLGASWLLDESFKVDIININFASQFLTHLSTSLAFGLVITFPYIIYEVWKFLRPALFPEEEHSVSFAFLFGTVMFFIGCALGYTVVFPLTFRFLTEYRISADIANQISLNSYMHNFIVLIFVMGLVFELPLLTWLLSKLGLVTKAFLKEYRKHAVVVLLTLAAFITPSGDPFTLSVVFLPLFLLYELGIKLAVK